MNTKSIRARDEVDYRIVPVIDWDCTSASQRGRENWIEVSARPQRTMQLFVSSIVNELLEHTLPQGSIVELRRQNFVLSN